MTTNIPQAGGLPGATEPPNWLNTLPNVDYNLDEKRWYGATKRTFGGGASDDASFRAIHATVNGQKFIYLSFRVKFQASLGASDSVYLGLQKHGTTDAMVIQIFAHDTSNTHAGPPPLLGSTNVDPAQIQVVKVWRSNAATSTPGLAGVWDLKTQTIGGIGGPSDPTTWIAANARAWVQDKSDIIDPMVQPNDGNSRWAIQLRIPVATGTDLFDSAGPNLGDDFDMWYFIQGQWSNGTVVISAENNLFGTTKTGLFSLNKFPYKVPNPANSNIPELVWDEHLLSSGAASFGGITINGNGSDDIGVIKSTSPNQNDVGTEIANGLTNGVPNGATNTFIVRPRNYRPSVDPITHQPINEIDIQHIFATIRIANFGTLPSGWADANTASWDLVPGTQPVPSNLTIPPLASGNPPATKPIKLENVTLIPPSNNTPPKIINKHQCIFVTLSGPNLNFLTDSAFKNMDYDHTSNLEREAEISIVGLTPISPQARDVYLALEKVNMPRNTPPGTNEGRFLESSVKKLIEKGGELGEKLKTAGSRLSDAGDYGSAARIEGLLLSLGRTLTKMKYSDPKNGLAALEKWFESLNSWLSAVKPNEGAAKRLAALFDSLAAWLDSTGTEANGNLTAFIDLLNQWLTTLNDDLASARQLPIVLETLRGWLATLDNDAGLGGQIETLQGWFKSDRIITRLPAILAALNKYLASLSASNNRLYGVIVAFSTETSRWLKGYERLSEFVTALSEAGLTEEETDQLFPTFRVHAYHDTGERVTGSDGQPHPVLRTQTSFGIYAYHEGGLDGWQTSIQGAQRIEDNLYLISVPNDPGTAQIKLRIQAVEPGEERMKEDPIEPIKTKPEDNCGCLCQILKIFGIGNKK